MPRLSESMRAALEAAQRCGCLEVGYGVWRAPDSRTWVARRTMTALTERGLLTGDDRRRMITPAGRRALEESNDR